MRGKVSSCALLLLAVAPVARGQFSGVLVGWDMGALSGGLNNYGPSPFAPTTIASNVASTGLTRGAGVGLTGAAAAQGWGGTDFTRTSASGAEAAGQYAIFAVGADTGYSISFSSIAFSYRRSSTGPSNGLLQYVVGNGPFTDIADVSYSSLSTSGASLGPFDLSTITELQNVAANVPVAFVIANYGATSSRGTWYILDAGGLDLVVAGEVTQVTPPEISPTLSAPQLAGNLFQFTLTGTAGSNYVVQATTDLGSGWTSLVTNAAPFTFSEQNTNGFSKRFYRAMVAP